MGNFSGRGAAMCTQFLNAAASPRLRHPNTWSVSESDFFSVRQFPETSFINSLLEKYILTLSVKQKTFNGRKSKFQLF